MISAAFWDYKYCQFVKFQVKNQRIFAEREREREREREKGSLFIVLSLSMDILTNGSDLL